MVTELLTRLAGDYDQVSNETLRGAWSDVTTRIPTAQRDEGKEVHT